MDIKKSLEVIEKTLLELIEENKKKPIIVEGEKDIIALKRLGVQGLILSMNSGFSVTDFCDQLAKKYSHIIILTDWDRRGGYLCHSIQKHLRGRVLCDLRYREIFAKNSMIRTIEGLPSWIQTMKENIGLV